MSLGLLGKDLYHFVECPNCNVTCNFKSIITLDELKFLAKNDFNDLDTIDVEIPVSCPNCDKTFKVNLKNEYMSFWNACGADNQKKKGFFGKLFGK